MAVSGQAAAGRTIRVVPASADLRNSAGASPDQAEMNWKSGRLAIAGSLAISSHESDLASLPRILASGESAAVVRARRSDSRTWTTQ